MDIIKIFTPTVLAFFIGIGITPFITHFLYKHKMWKKKAGKGQGIGGGTTPVYDELYKERDVSAPNMGGTVIWISAFITIFIFYFLATFFSESNFASLDILKSSKEVWLPLFTLMVGAFVGLIDDYFETKEKSDEGYLAGGLSLKKRLLVVLLMSLVGVWWFYTKLDMSSVLIPFIGELEIGWLFIPFFILVMLGMYSSGTIDGLDGLSGGVFIASFASYGFVAFFIGKIDLATFCFVIVGGLLAFLWFNIPPARFYMSETGTMALTMTLTVVAFLTRYEILLPIIAFPLVMTVTTTVIQVASKKLRNGKKVFIAAPIHHHFEALGWPHYKITMRYWIISSIFAILGLIIALIGNV